MPGTDDRRRRPAARNAVPSEPLEGAPGWRVTRRNGAPPEGGIGTSRSLRPGVVGEPTTPSDWSQPMPIRPIARSPRRVAAPGRRRRGISLLALAAAAAVVAGALGLAVLDTQGVDGAPARFERSVPNQAIDPAGAGTGATGQRPDGALAGRPG